MLLYLSIRRQGLKKGTKRPSPVKLKQAARIGLEKASKWQLPAAVELSLLLTDDAGIQALNSRHRGLDKPTDVLSFPLWESQPPLLPQDHEPLALGDIVISLERAEAQAQAYGHSNERETVFLFVHGLLHLLGYDHELGPEAETEMFALQKQIMANLSLFREEA